MRSSASRVLGSVLGVALFQCLGAGGGRCARADDVYTVTVKKQEQKKKTRWSLAEWLETKERIRLMDQWLALHSPSPYEFFVSGIYGVGTEPSSSGWGVSAAAYASIVGLEAQYESNGVTSASTFVDLRLFGYHNQGSNITVEGGLRHLNYGGSSVRSPLLGAKLCLYLNRFSGFEGLVRHFYESTAGAVGAGKRYEAGAFIDFQFIRIFGDYFRETTPETRAGVNLGARFYF